MPESERQTEQEDLFFTSIIEPYVAPPRFVRRDWLAAEVGRRLREPTRRFVLLSAEPGAGKSTFMAQLAHDRRDWPRYFIRRDQSTPLGDVGAHSFLLRIGYQLAAIHPELFRQDRIELAVSLRIGTAEADSEIVGAEVERILASPFHKKVADIQLQVERSGAKVVGLKVTDQLVVDPQLLDLSALQNMALFDPARALLELDPTAQIVILVDALDEIRYHTVEDNILKWLTNCPELPANVRFVLSSRPPDGAVRTFAKKQEPYLKGLTIAPEDSRVQADMQLYLDRLVARHEVASELKKTKKGVAGFATQAMAKADGNLGYLDALERGMDGALERDDRPAIQALLALRELPADLRGLYAFFLHQIQSEVQSKGLGVQITSPSGPTPLFLPAWPAVYNPILGVLAVALAPLTPVQIRELGGIAADLSFVNDALGRLAQFLDRPDGRCRLYHATLPEFLTAEATWQDPENQDLAIQPATWHGKIAEHYMGSGRDWNRADDYGLRYLALHLYHADNHWQRKLYKLINSDWRRLKLDRLHSDHSFLGDIELALDMARHETSDRLPRYIGLCMMAATIVTKSNDLIPEAIGAMMALDQKDRALAYTETITDAGVRSGTLLQMARASWHESKVTQAQEYLEAALKDGQRESVRTIYGNPEPLFKDLIRWGRIDEAVAINNLFHTRMPSIMNSRLAESQQELARHICTEHPSMVSRLRGEYPETFGRLVAEDGTINPDFHPPQDKGVAVYGLQEFEADPGVHKIYQPCMEALARARAQLTQENVAAAQIELDAIEADGANRSWILAGKGSFSIGSEPWWPALVLRARAGPVHRLEELADEIELSLDARSWRAWGGRMAYSAALGEAAIQLARSGQPRHAKRLLERLMSYCESLDSMENQVDVFKTHLAALFQSLYGLAQESQDVLESRCGEVAQPSGGWWPWRRSRATGLTKVVTRYTDPPTSPTSEQAKRWLAELAVKGKKPPDVAPIGTRSDIRLGASLAQYVNELLESKSLESRAEARGYLEVALEWVCSGQWEPTRWWTERTEGIALIGHALHQLAPVDHEWAESFLMRYFDKARFNGRHACWLHLLYALPTLHLLDQESLPQTWNQVAAVEEWVSSGHLRRTH